MGNPVPLRVWSMKNTADNLGLMGIEYMREAFEIEEHGFSESPGQYAMHALEWLLNQARKKRYQDNPRMAVLGDKLEAAILADAVNQWLNEDKTYIQLKEEQNND